MFFFLLGLLMVFWVICTFVICDIFFVLIVEMGGVFFGLLIGLMSGIFCLVWLVKCFGIRNVILVMMFCVLIGMMILSLVFWLILFLFFVVGFGVFGVSFGFVEVVINVEGVVVE